MSGPSSSALPLLKREQSISPSHQPKKPRLDELSLPKVDVEIETEVGLNSKDITAVKKDTPDPASPLLPEALPSAPADAAKKTQPKKGKKKQKRPPPAEPGSPEDVIWRDIVALLGQSAVDQAVREGKEWDTPLAFGQELELVVSDISSNGEAISILPSPHPPWAVLVPFALPGEKIRARVYRHARLHSYADLLSVLVPNESMRDMSRVQCQYFGRCGGCQYQMLSYETQLDLKRQVVEKAYRYFSALDPSRVPMVLPTIPSPKQYGYRTKLTPHFDVPPRPRGKGKEKKKEDAGAAEKKKEWELRIGFDEKGRKRVIDIEECPIATSVLNKALGPAKEDVRRNINTYKRGATILLRDSLVIPSSSMEEVIPKSTGESPFTDDPTATEPTVDIQAGEPTALDTDNEPHVCISKHKDTVRERVGNTLFHFPAGSFFQNNNSVLEPLTTYVKDAIFSPPSTDSEGAAFEKPTHLVDTYCGSGLFSLTLSPHFEHVAGIEIDPKSIEYAKLNLALNGLSASKHAFHAGKSESIFSSVLQSSAEPFPPEKTVVVIDPPRKGCDEAFLDQVVALRPAVLVYVSCNVHTQARDVGLLLRKTEGDGRGAYRLESLRGFDLFPQTAHVESVAVLRLG
ncbi:hypothetical protein BOTBODRAFT_29750 [Botryobasidium botryosum FD-172 SS1]|uniref:TRAM domain-containing protein n=1 Tax=Botryobasidium botryosum (strain FD-172 SS1) TaxID=930990 RepID=A0A067MS86_BOTB1|nr:hypothetical protein BOTBODRAFT_29750 [Botryobasidium botryosum FD-172 SS1]